VAAQSIGLSSPAGITVDDTSARHKATNGFRTQIAGRDAHNLGIYGRDNQR
jgi:hypothetical protein